MRLVIKNNEDIELDKMVIPMISVITALRNAIDTDSDMLENPPIFEGDSVSIDMYWETDVSQEQENLFKRRTLNALRYIFDEAEVNYEIEWE